MAVCEPTCGISILLGKRNGVFGAPVFYKEDLATSIMVADFNGDGNQDLAAADGGVSILLGNGDGTFQPRVGYAVGADFYDTGEFR